MNDFDFYEGWGSAGDEHAPYKRFDPKRDLIPKDAGYKKCSSCNMLVVFFVLRLPNNFVEWRTFCPRCRYLERFVIQPKAGFPHYEEYEKSAGFASIYWEFIK
jgi:hypothetical protein